MTTVMLLATLKVTEEVAMTVTEIQKRNPYEFQIKTQHKGSYKPSNYPVLKGWPRNRPTTKEGS